MKRLKFYLLKEYWEGRQDSYWQWTLFLLTTINYNPVQKSFYLTRAGPSQAIKQKIKLKYSHDALESMKFLKNSQGIEFIKWLLFFFNMVCCLLSQANTGCLEEEGGEHSLKQMKDRHVAIRIKWTSLGRKNALNCCCHPPTHRITEWLGLWEALKII